MNSLDTILAPISLETFFSDYYEKQYLLIKSRSVDAVYPGFPRIEDFEELLWRHEEKLYRILRVNKGGQYKQIPPRGSGKDVFRWSIDSFYEGYTLILNGTDHLSKSIAEVARSIETEIGGKVAANAFLTPPDNQGFLPHFDTHDVFILQLEGQKKWLLFDERIKLPVDRQIYLINQTDLPEPQLEVLLEPGDILYIPRGTIHGAFTLENPSLHLTMGYRPLRWSDYLKALLAVTVESNVELRESIRPKRLGLDKSIIQEKLQLVVKAAESARTRRMALDRFDEGLIAQFRPLPGKHLSMCLSADKINQKTKVRRRSESVCHVYEVGDFVRIQFPGIGIVGSEDLQPGSIQAPLTAAGIFRFIAETTSPFTAEDLPAIISEETRISIIKRLVREGLLIIEN